MNQYLLTILIKKDLPEGERQELLEGVKKNMTEVKKEDLWGNRNLSYPIKHQTDAFYAHYEFEADPKQILNLDRQVKLNEDVIRYLILKKD